MRDSLSSFICKKKYKLLDFFENFTLYFTLYTIVVTFYIAELDLPEKTCIILLNASYEVQL